MKKSFYSTLLLMIICEVSFSQIDQKKLQLSDFIKENFPYNYVKENNCDSQFVGVFYIGFSVNLKGKLVDIKFWGIEHLRLISIFNNFLTNHVYFTDSFTLKNKGKMIYQPIFYSIYNCLNDPNIKFDTSTNINEIDKQVYKNAFELVSSIDSKLKKSILKGFPMPFLNGYFEGIMLSPCILDADPKLGNRKTK